MNSCSPISFVFDSSPSLKPLKASSSLSSVIKFSPLKASGSLPSLDFSKLKSFKSSASMPSWEDTLNKINKINLPALESLKSSSSPKSFIDCSKINFDFLENYKPNSLKASSSISSWQDTLNKINKINLPILDSWKSSSSPKSFDYIDFKTPKFEMPKIEPVKPRKYLPILDSWKSSSSPKSFDYFKNYFDKIKLPIIEPIKNNLEASVSSPSILDFSHFKTKENNLFRNLNKNEDNQIQTNYFNISEKKKKETLKIRDFPNSGFQLHIHEENDIIKEAGIKIYGEKKQFKVLYPGKKNSYEISMIDLYADKLNLNKIIK